VPCAERWGRDSEAEIVCDGFRRRFECVSSNQVAVSLIHQCNRAGGVSRRVEDEQRSDPVAMVRAEHQGSAGADDDLDLGEAIAQLFSELA
jgi:hypothetical protein